MSARRSPASREISLGDGLHLHVARGGDGPPILLLHGFTGSTRSWESLTAALDRYSTIAVDLPGHGRSSAPPEPARYALRRFADDLAATLDALQVDRAAVLGYSLGGRAALLFALAHPARVAALVLESVSPGVGDADERAARLASDAVLADTIERDGIPAFVDEWERLPLWASQTSLSQTTRSRLREQRLANDARGLANSLRGAGAGVDASMLERIADIGVPTLLIAGVLDTKYAALARTLEARIPDARLALVPDAGHAVHLERSAVFADLVTRFLDEVRSARGAWR